MAINLNDNIKINAGKPSESKYLNTSNAPYTGTSQVLSEVPIGVRYAGLTVNVNNVEYWFATGVTNGDLIEKTPSIASGGGITGATNGLTKVGANAILGGTLTGDTVIGGDNGSYSLTLGTPSGSQNLKNFSSTGSGVGTIDYPTLNLNGNSANDTIVLDGTGIHLTSSAGIIEASSTNFDLDDAALTIDLTGAAAITTAGDINLTSSAGNLIFSSANFDIDDAALTIDLTGGAAISTVNDLNLTSTSANIVASSANFDVDGDDLTFTLNNSATIDAGGAGTITLNSNNLKSAADNFEIASTNTISLSSDGNTLIYAGAADLSLSAATITVGSNSGGFEGAKYAADYSSNYTSRSIPDVDYVTGFTTSSGVQTANNGLTRTGTNVHLGGVFTGSTQLDGNSNTYGLQVLDMGFITLDSGDITVSIDGTMGELNITSISGSFAGARYTSDYSANFQDRSLVDKGYVAIVTGETNTTASNGLTKTGNDIALGGTLTSSTLIDGDGTYNFTVNNSPTITLGATDLSLTATNDVTVNGTNSTILGGTNNITIGSTGALVTLGGSNTFRYNSDYSANYTDRSLVDKGYVDTISVGLDPKASAKVATVSAMTGTYIATGGTNASGSFTGASTTIDGIALSVGDRLLVKNQADAKQNGLYYLITTGGTWYRTTDQDGTPAAEVSTGNYVFITTGATNAASGWVIIGTGDTLTLNTDNINWVQFSASISAYLGGDGIDITGANISIDLASNSGLDFNSGQLRVNPTIAGSGLTLTTGVLNVGANNGLSVNGTNVKLGGSLTGSTNIALTTNQLNLTGSTGGVTIGNTGNTITANNAEGVLIHSTLGSGAGIYLTEDNGSGIYLSSTNDGGIYAADTSYVEFKADDNTNATFLELSTGYLDLYADFSNGFAPDIFMGNTILSISADNTGNTTSSNISIANTGKMTTRYGVNNMSTIQDIMTFQRTAKSVPNAPLVGFGGRLGFQMPVTNTGVLSTTVGLAYSWTDVTASSFDGKYTMSLHVNHVATDIVDLDRYGWRYLGDYSANFTNRSLVDRAYVTGLTTTSGIQTANNGLTKSGTNARLGGTLTGNTSILGGNFNLDLGTSGSKLNQLNVNTDDYINLYSEGSANNVFVGSSYLGGSDFSAIELKVPTNNSTTAFSLYGSTTGDTTFFEFRGSYNNVQFIDGRSTPKGVEYAGNYSANFTPRSLVDKGYVTGLTTTSGIQTANNGLTKIGTNVVLGGTLTGDTVIGGDSGTYSLTLGSVGSNLDNLNSFGGGAATFDYPTINIFGDSANKQIVLDSTGIEVTLNNNDFRYAADYSANFTPRSLVDKAYVTGLTTTSGLQTANNGLTKSGLNVRLGGSLTGNTLIDGVYNINFGDTGNYIKDFQVRSESSFNRITSRDGSGTDEAGIEIDSNFTPTSTLFAENITGGTRNQLVVSTSLMQVQSSISGFQGLQYDTDYSSNYTLRSIPDVNFVTGLTSSVKVNKLDVRIVNGATATLTNDDHVILVNTSGATTITLPSSPVDGQVYHIKDKSGNGLSNMITVDGNGNNIDGSSTAVINTDYGSLHVVYSSTEGAWFGLAFIN